MSYLLRSHSRQPNQSFKHRQLLKPWPRRHSVNTPLRVANQVPTGPEVNTGGENFEIKTGLIMMAQASPLCGKANEDASAHLQQFLELCSTFVVKGVSQDAIRLRLFPFSLLGRAKQWFYANNTAMDT